MNEPTCERPNDDDDGNSFTRDEVGSIYVGESNRYIVSLVVGYDEQRSVAAPLDAAASALAMVREGVADAWHVFDRELRTTHRYAQREILAALDARRPFRPLVSPNGIGEGRVPSEPDENRTGARRAGSTGGRGAAPTGGEPAFACPECGYTGRGEPEGGAQFRLVERRNCRSDVRIIDGRPVVATSSFRVSDIGRDYLVECAACDHLFPVPDAGVDEVDVFEDDGGRAARAFDGCKGRSFVWGHPPRPGRERAPTRHVAPKALRDRGAG